MVKNVSMNKLIIIEEEIDTQIDRKIDIYSNK